MVVGEELVVEDNGASGWVEAVARHGADVMPLLILVVAVIVLRRRFGRGGGGRGRDDVSVLLHPLAHPSTPAHAAPKFHLPPTSANTAVPYYVPVAATAAHRAGNHRLGYDARSRATRARGRVARGRWGARYAGPATGGSGPASARKIFIDGEAGTTGLQVRQRLEGRSDVQVLQIDPALRKDVAERARLINEADVVILCLPDAAAIEASRLVNDDNTTTTLIDASTAHRCDPSWTYGFPELLPGGAHKQQIQQSRRIANPGCYATGFIALTRPLVEAGLLPAGVGLTVSAVSGYSGGGNGLIDIFERKTGSDEFVEPWGAYGLGLQHKHLPEMALYSGLGRKPVFSPAVGTFAQGMVVTVMMHMDQFNQDTTSQSIHDAYANHYGTGGFVEVMPLGEAAVSQAGLLQRGAFLEPTALNNTNRLQVFVFDNGMDGDEGTVMLMARLDNLGKGASGAAVQNMNLALGLDEFQGL